LNAGPRRFWRRREIGAEKGRGEFRGPVGVGENAGSVDEGWAFAAVGKRCRIGER